MEREISGVNYRNLAFAALIFGVGLSLFGIFAVVKSLTAKGWHTTSGIVVESKVIDGFDSIDKPYISYRYEVDGKSYTSDNISFLAFGGDSFAEKAVEDYPQNKVVTVYYDPINPAKSLLEPRLSITAVLTLIAGIMCLGIWRLAKARAKIPGGL